MLCALLLLRGKWVILFSSSPHWLLGGVWILVGLIHSFMRPSTSLTYLKQYTLWLALHLICCSQINGLLYLCISWVSFFQGPIQNIHLWKIFHCIFFSGSWISPLEHIQINAYLETDYLSSFKSLSKSSFKIVLCKLLLWNYLQWQYALCSSVQHENQPFMSLN